jgi:hypothetical protein
VIKLRPADWRKPQREKKKKRNECLEESFRRCRDNPLMNTAKLAPSYTLAEKLRKKIGLVKANTLR